MKFSIVTISFNQARFLEQAIRSVLDQDYPDVEYIVVDPGSTDGSREIIERYRDRIDKVIFEPDRGPADGLNKGFAHATGDVYGYINSDDALLPGALSRVASAFRKHPNADVVSGHLYQVDENQRVIRRLRASKFHPKRFVYGGVQVAQQSTFFRGSAFRATAGFNPGNHTGWDAELLLDMAIEGRNFSVIEKYLALFRIHEGTITASSRLDKEKVVNRLRYFKKVIGRHPRSVDKVLRQMYRVDKWRRDPVGLAIRLYDAIIVPVTAKIIPLHTDWQDEANR